MKVENALGPNADQKAAFAKPKPGGPIYLVNLLKFRERATYPDGRQTDLSGRDAYYQYVAGAEEIFSKSGGELVFAGDVAHLRLGDVEDLWDEIVILKYPSQRNMVAMTISPEWQAASVHRTAGLDGQLNIETVESPVGVYSGATIKTT